MDFLDQSLAPARLAPPGEAPLRVVPGENKLVRDEAVILLPLVSLWPIVTIGDDGTMFDPED